MEKPSYHFKASPDALVYEFESINGAKYIRKVVVYEPLIEELYHLGFGDLTENGDIDYKIQSKNQYLSHLSCVNHIIRHELLNEYGIIN